MSSAAEHKDRLIAQLKQESVELRTKEHDYKTLQDKLLNLEQNFNKLNEEKRKMDDDYKARIDTNLATISTIKSEIDDGKHSLAERKSANNQLYAEIDRQKEALSNRNVEASRLKGDLIGQQDLHASLQNQKKQLEDDLSKLRERNHEDMQEIDKLNVENDHKGKESVDMAAQIRANEYDISKALGKIDDLQRVIDQKSADTQAKDNQLAEIESDVAKLKGQNANYKNELEHLKNLEQRYRSEN